MRNYPAVNSHGLGSPLRYPGGKNRVAKRFTQYFPEHTDYREIFAGGAAVFFQKPLARKNWLNDLHYGLYAFYVAVRDRFDEFAALCREQTGDLRSRFDYWVSRRNLMEADGDEDILERAVQYFFINRTVWGGRVVYDAARASRLYFSNPQGLGNIEKKLSHLRQVSAKLQGVRVTCLDFTECLSNVVADTFVYADPPYFRDSTCSPTDKLYDQSFDVQDHIRLAEALRNTPAKVMLSYDDCPQVRRLYDGWNLIELTWKYAGRYAVTKDAKIAGMKEKKVDGRELLIMNYAINGGTAKSGQPTSR